MRHPRRGSLPRSTRGSRSHLLPPNGRIQPALRRHASKLVQPSVLEPHAAAGNDVANRGGNQDLSGARERGEASAEVNRNATKPAVLDLALTRVDSRSHLESKILDLAMERAREGQGESGNLERCQESVTGRIDLAPPEASKDAAEPIVMTSEQLSPGTIAHLEESSGRVHDVREQDGRQDAVREGLQVLEPPALPVRLVHLGPNLPSARSRMT